MQCQQKNLPLPKPKSASTQKRQRLAKYVWRKKIMRRFTRQRSAHFMCIEWDGMSRCQNVPLPARTSSPQSLQPMAHKSRYPLFLFICNLIQLSLFIFFKLVRKRLKQRRRERRKMTQKTQRGQVYVSGLSESLKHNTWSHTHVHTRVRTRICFSQSWNVESKTCWKRSRNQWMLNWRVSIM